MSDQAPDAVILVDASVLVELVVAGRHAASADRLLAHLEERPETDIITAAHGLIEALSALRRFNLAGTLGDADAEVACQMLRRLDLRLDATGPRMPSAWALRHSMTAYDAAYAAAAIGLRTPLISTDQPLLRACETAGISAVHLDRFAPVPST
ncbi:MAG: type II toxin-antitoxin system VapC family toxin [Patulibacter sp.]